MIFLKKSNYLIEFIIIGIAGTLFHFVYALSGENRLAGYFFPVNESTWEHLKLLFFPSLIYSVSEYALLTQRPKSYIPASVIGIFGGMAAITVFFYTYTGILGYDVSFLNIFSFFFGLFVMLLIKAALIKNKAPAGRGANYIALLLAGVLAILFVRWSYYPPTLGIFTNPIY